MKEKIIELLQSGKSFTEIAAELKIEEKQITEILKEENSTVQKIADTVAEKTSEKIKALETKIEELSKFNDLQKKVLELENAAGQHGEQKFLYDASAKQAPGVIVGMPRKVKELPKYQKDFIEFLHKSKIGDKMEAPVFGDSNEFEESLAMQKLRREKGLKHLTVAAGVKALDSSSGNGLEMIPESWASAVYTRMGDFSELAPKFEQLPMQTKKVNIAEITTRPSVYYNDAVDYNPTESSPGTAEKEITARKIKGKTYLYEDTEYDSLVSLFPIVERNLGEALAWGVDDFILNGDRTGTHQDSDTNGVTNHVAKAEYGLRYYALAVAALKQDFSTGGLSASNLDLLMKLMGKYHTTNPERCGWIVGTKGFNTVKTLDDFKKYINAGVNMSMFDGAVKPYQGSQWAYSTKVRENLNASGVYDGVTTTKGNVMLCRFDHFIFGNYYNMVIERDKDIETGKHILVLTWRGGFVPFETPSATVSTVTIGYNYNA